MEIRLLKKGYRDNEALYRDFLADKLSDSDEYFSNEVVYIEEAPVFPVYINAKDEETRNRLFNEAFRTIAKYYLDTERDIHLSGGFWHSLLCVHMRGYLLEHYPEIKESYRAFKNIVFKKFDWENYIYKCVLGAQYIEDNTSTEDEAERYYKLIVNNLDLYNYIIKYEIFRNDRFLLNVLDIVDEHELSKVLKKKLVGRDDLGKDERIGRRVIFEFNKSYPVVLSPMLSKEELEPLFLENLRKYA